MMKFTFRNSKDGKIQAKKTAALRVVGERYGRALTRLSDT
jgi:hypothetical protein